MGFGSEAERLHFAAPEEAEDEGDDAGEEEATRVDSEPWVMMTSRGREAFDLGKLAIAVAIWATDESCGRKA